MSRPDAPEAPPGPLEIPWGTSERLALGWPAGWPAPEVVWPDLPEPLTDYSGALAHALDNPEGNSPTLGALIRPGSKVALVVDDPSRWTPVREALSAVLARVHGAGARVEDVTVSVGVGRHHAVDGPAMRARVGDGVADRYRCFSPPVDDLSAYLDLGTTPEGVPVRVFRPVAEADVRVLIGSTLPHLQAGFGGGYKLIFPGTSHRTTLGALHRQGLGPGGDPATLLGGDPTANPMRRAISSAAALLGPCVSVSHLIGAPGEVFRVRAGHPDLVQAALSDEARARLRAPEGPPTDLVVAGNHPWPGDPLQSFKVLLQHRAACRTGGVLVGFFWTDPGQIDRSFPLPALKVIGASGVLGDWVLRRSLAAVSVLSAAFGSPGAFMVRWARELVVDRTVLVFAPPLHARFGPRLGPVRLFADQAELWRAAAAALAGTPSPRSRVFPKGGLTYAPSATAASAPGVGAGAT